MLVPEGWARSVRQEVPWMRMAALEHAIFLTVIAVIAVIAAAIVMWLFAAFYGAFAMPTAVAVG